MSTSLCSEVIRQHLHATAHLQQKCQTYPVTHPHHLLNPRSRCQKRVDLRVLLRDRKTAKYHTLLPHAPAHFCRPYLPATLFYNRPNTNNTATEISLPSQREAWHRLLLRPFRLEMRPTPLGPSRPRRDSEALAERTEGTVTIAVAWACWEVAGASGT